MTSEERRKKVKKDRESYSNEGNMGSRTTLNGKDYGDVGHVNSYQKEAARERERRAAANPTARHIADVRARGNTAVTSEPGRGRFMNIVKSAFNNAAGSYRNAGATFMNQAEQRNLDKDYTTYMNNPYLQTRQANGDARYGVKKYDSVEDMMSNTKEWNHETRTKRLEEQREKAQAQIMKSEQQINEAKEGLGKVGQFAVDVAQQGMLLGSDVALSAATFGGAGLMSMGARAFGSGAYEAAQNGASLDNQFKYGALSAAVETATEKLFAAGSLMKKTYGKGAVTEALSRKLSKNFASNFANTAEGKILKEALGEGFEEVVSDIANPIIKTATGQGDDAEWYNSADFWKGAAYDGLMGAVLGGVMGGGGVLMDKYNGSQIDSDTIEKALSAGEKAEDGSKLKELTKKYKASKEAGNVTDNQTMDLVREAYSESYNSNEAVTQYNLADALGISLTEGDRQLFEYAVGDEMYTTALQVDDILKSFSGVENGAVTDENTAKDNSSNGMHEASDSANMLAMTLRGLTVDADAQVQQLLPGNEAERTAFTQITGMELPEDSQGTIMAVKNYMNVASVDLAEQAESRISRQFMIDYDTPTDMMGTMGAYGQKGYAYTVNEAMRKNAGNKMLSNAQKRANVYSSRGAYEAYYAAGQDSTKETKGAILERLERTWGSSGVSKEVRMRAFNAGENDKAELRRMAAHAQSESKSARVKTGKVVDRDSGFSEEQVKGFKVLSEVLGIKIELAERDENDRRRANGTFDTGTGTLTVFRDSETPYIFTVAHEFTHYLRYSAPQAYQEFADYVASQLNSKAGESFEDAINETIRTYRNRAGQKLTRDEAIEEILADSAVKFFEDEDSIRALAQENKTLASKIIEFIDKILNAIKSLGSNEQNLGSFYDELGILEEARSLYAKAIKEAGTHDARFNAGGKKYSIDSLSEALGITFSKDDNGFTVFKDKDGKTVDRFTKDFVRKTPIGAVLANTEEKGMITGEEVEKQLQFYADLMQELHDTQDIDLIWAINGTIGYNPMPEDFVDENGNRVPSSFDNKKTKFAALTGNADPQYSKTIDFTTICLKTQAVVDAMSQTMIKLGRGLSKDEIIDVVFKNVYEADEPVPCPVCYVFSRWVGLGELFDKMKRLQIKYEDAPLSEIRSELGRLNKEVEKIMAGSSSMKKSAAKEKLKKSYEKKYAEMKERYNDLDEIDWMSKNVDSKIPGLSEKEKEELVELKRKLDIIDEWSWIENVRLHNNYNKQGKVPDHVLFDLNNAREFAEKYPVAWKYRTTRGPSLGKAAAPYSPEVFGQVLKGASTSGSTLKNLGNVNTNYFININKDGSIPAKGKAQLEKSRQAVKIQNLLNGQRMQSTSDFRYEYALDYLLAYTELQALGAKVQMYTKVPEAVGMHATVGAEVNLSLMPLGVGLDENGNLVFSDVTGMNFDDAKMLQEKYDNVQTILVAVSPEHLIAAMADDDIKFIIPYHSSGGTEERYVKMMDIVGETVSERTDFGSYEGDSKISDATTEQKAARSLREKIITGKAMTLSQNEKDILKGNEILRQLYMRFYGVNENGEPEQIDKRFVDPGALSEDGTRDNNCYHTFMPGKHAEFIMPYEYWDKTGTIENADDNARRYVSYCESIGMHPKFSGWTKDGKKYNENMNFTEYPGYWKTLIDRRMYNNDGSYHEQKPINISNFSSDLLYSEKNQDGLKFPSRSNDRSKTNEIASKSAEEITEKRYSITHDSDGKKLTPEQMEYFKNSKAVDENGNLLKLYHGTADGGFTAFNSRGESGIGIWATNDIEVASAYSLDSEDEYAPSKEDGPTDERFTNYVLYYNLENPLVIKGGGRFFNDLSETDKVGRRFTYVSPYMKVDDDKWDISYEIIDNKSGRPLEETKEFTRKEAEKFFGKEATDAVFDNEEHLENVSVDKYGNDMIHTTNDWTVYAHENGYDGVIFEDIVDGGEFPANVYVAFSSEQVKSVNNDNPTHDDDIRYSITPNYSEMSKDELEKSLRETRRLVGVEKRKVASRDKKIEKIKQHNKDVNKRKADKKRRSEAIAKMKRVYDRLYPKTATPSDTAHLPENFKTLVTQFMASIDFESERSNPDSRAAKARKEKRIKLAGLAKELVSAAENENSQIVVDYQQAQEFAEASNEINNLKLSELSTEDIEGLYMIMRNLEQIVGRVNKSFTDGIAENISERANQAVNEIRDTKKVYNKSGLMDQLNNYITSNVKPRDFFRVLAGEDGALYKAYLGIRNAWARHVDNMTDFRDAWDKAVTYKQVREWRKQSTKFTLESGEEIRLTVPQIMSLYELNKRDQARGHIYGVGIVASDEKLSRKAKKEDKGGKNRQAFVNKRVNVTVNDVSKITATLTDEQRQVASRLQNIMGTMGSSWGNEASMTMYNYRKFTEKNYFPIDVLDTWLDEKAGVSQPQRLRTLGMTKQVKPNADNPLVLDDIFSVTVGHMNKMSMYTMTPELTDFERIWNFKDKEKGLSLREEFQASYGENATRYVTNLMNNVNGYFAKDDNIQFFDQLLSRFKRAKVGASLRVLVQQPMSIIRAGDQINSAYLAAAIPRNLTQLRKGMREMQEHNATARWKSWGFYDTDTAKSMESIIERKRELSDVTMGMYGFADNVTWAAIWQATKMEVNHNHPDVAKNSDEYWKLVNDRFDAIVDYTQVVDSVFHRSQIMRSKNVLAKGITAFMSEPTTSVNMLRTETLLAARDIKSGNKASATKRMSKVIGVFVANGIGVSVASGLIDAVRHSWTGDDDDDEEKKNFRQMAFAKAYELTDMEAIMKLDEALTNFNRHGKDEEMNFMDRWIAHSKKNLSGNLNPLEMLPITKDIFSLLEGYPVERADISMISNMLKSINDLQDYLNGDSSHSMFYIINDMLGSVSEYAGIPYKNTWKDAQGIVRTLNEAKGHGEYINAAYNALMYAPKDWNIDRQLTYYEQARASGKTADAQRIMDNIRNSSGASDEDINKLINKKYRSSIKDAVENGGDVKEAVAGAKSAGYSQEELAELLKTNYGPDRYVKAYYTGDTESMKLMEEYAEITGELSKLQDNLTKEKARATVYGYFASGNKSAGYAYAKKHYKEAGYKSYESFARGIWSTINNNTASTIEKYEGINSRR